MRRRTRSRELALQYLYATDSGGIEKQEALDDFLTRSKASQEHRRFATLIVEGVVENQANLDDLIEKNAKNWSLSRIALVDRNILRLAAFEIMHCPDIPRQVAINEAVELGKRYSTAQSGSFINGILDRLHPSEAPITPDPKPQEKDS